MDNVSPRSSLQLGFERNRYLPENNAHDTGKVAEADDARRKVVWSTAENDGRGGIQYVEPDEIGAVREARVEDYRPRNQPEDLPGASVHLKRPRLVKQRKLLPRPRRNLGLQAVRRRLIPRVWCGCRNFAPLQTSALQNRRVCWCHSVRLNYTRWASRVVPKSL